MGDKVRYEMAQVSLLVCRLSDDIRDVKVFNTINVRTFLCKMICKRLSGQLGR